MLLPQGRVGSLLLHPLVSLIMWGVRQSLVNWRLTKHPSNGPAESRSLKVIGAALGQAKPLTPDSDACAQDEHNHPVPQSRLPVVSLPLPGQNQRFVHSSVAPWQAKCFSWCLACRRVKRESTKARKRKGGYWLRPILPERVTKTSRVRALRGFQGPGRLRYLQAPPTEYNGTEAIRLQNLCFRACTAREAGANRLLFGRERGSASQRCLIPAGRLMGCG